MLTRILRPVVQLREGEAPTAVLMFAYSFLAMAGYNTIKPVTRGLFIEKLGAENLPWVQFGSGLAIGLIMQGYTRAATRVPRRWMVPVTLGAITAGMALFYLLFENLRADRGVAVGFYLFGLIVGILLISQFWTLANDVYDPRQAKRLFGFIGAGSSLGAFAGATATTALVADIGANAMLLVSAGTLAVCTGAVALLVWREPGAGRSDGSPTGETEGVGGAEAWRLLTSSRHLQVIAMVIAFAAVGAAIIEQQVNMAAAEAKGATNVDAVTAFLAQITAYLSLIGFVVQLAVTGQLHRSLGIGVALLVLPIVDATTGLMMLAGGTLWTAGLARVMDTSLRYTVDKTTREVLFLPLPVDIKYRAKPFIDVTVDRVAKGLGALLLLVLVQEWGLHLGWRQLSYASLTVMAVWAAFALTARREYLKAFRRSIEGQQVRATDIALTAVDPASVETLVGELSSHEPRRVLYAIDLLESMGKRRLIAPLLLKHDEAGVRVRALEVAAAAGAPAAERWLPGVRRALADPEPAVRTAAVAALAALGGRQSADVMRPYLDSADTALAVVAAAALADSGTDADVARAADTLRTLSLDARAQHAGTRRLVAQALGQVRHAAFRQLLVPLVHDADPQVARAAIESAGAIGPDGFLLVPSLVSRLGHRALKSAARRVLVGYGDEVVAPLAHFMLDEQEAPWVRRHVPATLARLPTRASVAALESALDSRDGFLRYKAIEALERIRRERPDLGPGEAAVARQVLADAARAFDALTLHHNLVVTGGIDGTSLLARALDEKHRRALARVFQVLALVHPPGDVAAVRQTLLGGDARLRSSAIEYLDNLLAGDVRRRVMLLVEEMPLDERVRKGNVLYRTRARDVEDTLAQLVHDDDQTIAAAAIHLVEERRLWSLAGDLEHVLAHRDARDWHAFEAASWALAAHRMPAERRRALWQEPLPAVEIADRLRGIPLFDFTSVDELFRLASLGRQARHEQGRQVCAAGEPPATVEFLLDGRLRSTAPSGAADITPPAALGVEQVLEGAPMPASLVAAEGSIVLSLTADEFLTHLADNGDLAAGLFRLLLAARPAGLASPSPLVLRGRLPRELAGRSASSLQTIDRVLLFQAIPLLARASASALVRMAGVARAVSWPEGGDPLARENGSAAVFVVTGEVSVEELGGRTERAGPGDTFGLYESLGSTPFTAKVTVAKAATALWIDRADLFDVLANHVELMQGIFSGVLHRTP